MRLSITATVACIIAGAAVTQSSQATADNLPGKGVGAGVRPQTVNIAAQDLSSALKSFAEQSKLYLIYAQGDVINHRTAGAIGELTADETLKQLLKDTGLTYRMLNDNTITIVPTSSKKTAASLENTNIRLAQSENPESKIVPTSQGSTEASEDTSVKLEEVIVTAQRRDERLLDTPISMSVLSGADLDQSTERALSEVLSQVGGVAITEVQPGRTVLTIRGVSTTNAFSSPAAFYIDEVPFALPRINEFPDVNAFDLSRVEVLRGPQGTLYGAGSLSGVVRIIPNPADVEDFEFKARTRFSRTDGSQDPNYGADFALNLPLIPGTLGIRAVAGYSEYDGFTNSNFDGTRDINDNESQNYRLSATWIPVSDLKVRLGVSRSELNSNATSMALDNYSTFTSADQPGDRTLDIYSVVAEYDWGGVSLLSATSYIDYFASDMRDRSVGTRLLRFLNIDDISQVSQEFRLVSDLDGPWQWSAGAIYLKADKHNVNDARPQLQCSGPSCFPSPFVGVAIEEVTNESYAVFGELTRSFADGRFDITAGLRLYQAEETLRDLGSLTNGPLVGTRTEEFEQPTGRLVLNYHPSDDVLLYASVGTGFRNGEIQGAAALSADPTLPMSEPDTLLSYEVGNKAQLDLGAFGDFTYDLAIYYLDWRDIQQGIGVSTPAFPAGFTGRVNAGTARGFGVDAGFTYNPNDVVSLWSSVGWSGLTFKETVTSFVNGAPRLLFDVGDRPDDSPEWTAAAGLDIRIPTVMNGIDFTASGGVSYGSERVQRALSGSPPTVTVTFSDPIKLANFGVGLANGTWTAELFVNNAFDEDGAVSPRQLNGRFEAPRARPRTIGIQVTFNY